MTAELLVMVALLSKSAAWGFCPLGSAHLDMLAPMLGLNIEHCRGREILTYQDVVVGRTSCTLGGGVPKEACKKTVGID